MEKSDLMRLIGNNVRRYRMERKMAQEELANLVGKNPSAITRIEGGQRMMSVHLLRAVAAALNVSCDALLWNDAKASALENITYVLSGQSEDSLAKLETIILTIIQEYGDTEDKLRQI